MKTKGRIKNPREGGVPIKNPRGVLKNLEGFWRGMFAGSLVYVCSRGPSVSDGSGFGSVQLNDLEITIFYYEGPHMVH